MARSDRARSGNRIKRQQPGWPLGCGIDVVEIDRFARVVKRSGEAFLRRVFTDGERRYARQFRDELVHLAARFAAKEAVVKAMAQVDPRHPLMIHDVEVCNDAHGRPSIRLRGDRPNSGTPMIAVSLSHAKRVAVASAIVGGKPARPRPRHP